MPDVLQFVDRVTASPTVRLDLNDDATWSLNYDGTDFSPPPLRQAWSSTMLADGELLTAAAYENRTVRLRLDLMTGSVDAAWAQMQALHRELNRESNYLKWQPQGSTNPVFFRTKRSMGTRVTEYPGPGLLRTVDVSIEADPGLIGPKETVPVAAVINDPASGQFFDVTNVKGDIEAPLFLSIPRTMALAQAGEQAGRRKTLVAVRRRGTPSAAPYLLQAEAMSSNPIPGVTDTSPSAPAGASGASARRTSFTATAPAARLRADPFPASAGVDVRGTYRAYARVATTDGSSTFSVRLDWGTAGFVVSNATTTLTRTTTAWTYVDLGLVQMPPGVDAAADALSGVADQVRGIRMDLVAGRTAGAGSLDWDFVVLAPADDRLLLAEWPDGGNVHANVTEFVLDPIAEAGYARDSSGVRYATAPVGIEGGFPLVTPGVTNRVTLIRDVGGWASGTDDSITSNPQPGAWYYPRYLYARPPTT